jgi:hypothetical protein
VIELQKAARRAAPSVRVDERALLSVARDDLTPDRAGDVSTSRARTRRLGRGALRFSKALLLELRDQEIDCTIDDDRENPLSGCRDA